MQQEALYEKAFKQGSYAKMSKMGNSSSMTFSDLPDRIIHTLMDPRSVRGDRGQISLRELLTLFKSMPEHLLNDPSCLELDLAIPLYVIGDLFGQFSDLVQIFTKFGDPSKQRYLFLGNYVDRGDRSLDTITLLFAYKVKYPKNIFLLRGNHECKYVSCNYGFLAECLHQYNDSVWQMVTDAFDALPVAAIIEEVIFCSHSGILPSDFYSKIRSQEQLRDLIAYHTKDTRTIAENDTLINLTWSEPYPNLRGWRENLLGMGFYFGEDEVERFCTTFGFDIIIRSNELLTFGYEMSPSNRILTILSATDMADRFRNLGAVVSLRSLPEVRSVILRIKVMKPLQSRNKVSLQKTLTFEDYNFEMEEKELALVKSIGSSPNFRRSNLNRQSIT